MDGDDATVASALRNPLVDPNMTTQEGITVLHLAVRYHRPAVLRVLLADSRVRRDHPHAPQPVPCPVYDDALRSVKRRRNARFKGVIRGYVVLRRMRLRAAQAVYAPGGAGFAAAAASFATAVVEQQQEGEWTLGREGRSGERERARERRGWATNRWASSDGAWLQTRTRSG